MIDLAVIDSVFVDVFRFMMVMPHMVFEDDSQDNDDSSSSLSDDSSSTDSDLEDALVEYYIRAQKRRGQMVVAAYTLGMYHHELHMNRSECRVSAESGYQWVTRTLGHRTQCYRMFRIRKECFDKLYSVLQSSYGLKSTCKMT